MKSAAVLPFLVSAFAAATPVPNSRQSLTERQTTPPNTTEVKIWTSEMHYIYPQHPDLSTPAVDHLHIETYGGNSEVEQVAVFRGIPPEAKSCTAGWSQGDKLDRVFITKGDSALTKMRPLSGFPADGAAVSFASIEPFDDATDEEDFGPDFTFWDDASYEATEHTGGSVACAEEIYIRVLLADPGQKGTLYMDQDEKNGLWVQYTL